MSISVLTVQSPVGETIFTDSNIGGTVDAIKASSATLLYVTVDNTANPQSTYVRLWNLASASVTNGTTVPDSVLYCPASRISTFPMYSGSTPGIVYGTALSASAVTTGGTSGNFSPNNPVTASFCFV